MRHNRSVPPTTVVPILYYRDVRAAVHWLSAAFGFIERTRIGESHRAQLSIGADGAMIVAEDDGDPVPGGGPTHVIRVRVNDVDASFELAREHGAAILEIPTDRGYGKRDFTVEDLAGHRWVFSESISDVEPEEYGCQTIAPWPTPRSPE